MGSRSEAELFLPRFHFITRYRASVIRRVADTG